MRYCTDIMTYGPKLVLVTGRFRIDGTNSPDRVVDGAPSNNKVTVARTSQGLFTVSLPQVGAAWPNELVSCLTQVSYIDAADAGVDEVNECRYVVDSYSRTAGTFQLMNVVVTGATVTAVNDPNDNCEIQFSAVLRTGSRDLMQT